MDDLSRGRKKKAATGFGEGDVKGFKFPEPGISVGPLSLEKITSVFSNIKLCSVPNVHSQSLPSAMPSKGDHRAILVSRYREAAARGTHQNQKSHTQKEKRALLECIESGLAERNFSFVEQMPKEVQTECSVCLNILQDPYIVECCGHRFCKTCIEKVVHEDRPCPLCMSPKFQKLPDKHLQRLLNQRKVYCLLKNKGCDWVGEMDKLKRHLLASSNSSESSKPLTCDFVPISCSGCKILVERRSMNNHKSACSMREIKCKFCKAYACPLRDMAHHYMSCPLYPVMCPNLCQMQISWKREDIKAHLEMCPLQRVDCEFRYAGCEARLLKGEVQEHSDKNVKGHLSLLSSKYKEIEAKYENLTKAHASGEGIAYLYVSNLPVGVHEQMLRSRFGQFGVISRLDMVPARNSVIVEFEEKQCYTRVLESRHSINLLKHRLIVTPISFSHF